MSIRPVDFNGMIQRTQDVSTLKQNEDNRPVVEQQTIFSQEMKKVDLRDQAGLTTNVLAKLGKNEHVSTQSLEKICRILECEVGDILEFIPNEK